MRKQGFSLLELLIYIAVIAVMSVIIAGTFLSVGKGRGQAEAREEVNSALRFAAEKISQDLRSVASSSDITSPASPGGSSSTLSVIVGGTVISYSTTTDGRVKRTAGAVSDAITPDVVWIDALNFTRFENTNAVLEKTFVSVEVNIGASYNSDNPDRQYSASKKTTIGIRN